MLDILELTAYQQTRSDQIPFLSQAYFVGPPLSYSRCKFTPFAWVSRNNFQDRDVPLPQRIHPVFQQNNTMNSAENGT
jgi:hypothetical protein